jgi:nucleoside phosphorylase
MRPGAFHPRYREVRHDGRVEPTQSATKRVAILAPMRPELKAVVRAGALSRTTGDPVFSHHGNVGVWSVSAGIIGMGPAAARAATERMLERGPFDHVMVVGIAGGLDPSLPVGALMVPSRVQLHPDGPLHSTHPLPNRVAEGGLMTTDGLFSDDQLWRPILESGFGAVDMEASGVGDACESAGVDWSIYRGISDRPDEHIVDQAVFGLSKPDGSPNLLAVGRYLAGDPRRAKSLAHLNRCMQVAAKVAAEAAFADLARAYPS